MEGGAGDEQQKCPLKMNPMGIGTGKGAKKNALEKRGIGENRGEIPANIPKMAPTKSSTGSRVKV